MTGAPIKLVAFTGILLAAFGAAYAFGGVADPVTDEAETAPHVEMTPSPGETPGTPHPEPTEHAQTPGGEATGSHSETSGHDEGGTAQAAALPGLAVSEAGYTLVPAATTLAAGSKVPFRFTVTGPDGKALTAYRETHEKDLHLIVVRRDLSGFQHVHPTLGRDGTWSIDLDLPTAGSWRVFADFQPEALGRTLTLGTDVTVAGTFRPVALPPAEARTTVDGYDVALTGRPLAGKESELTFTVTRQGRPVTDLEPYLGAFGHLVSLRAGDLAYLHTHPIDDAHADGHGGPRIRFGTTFPTAGTYRLYLDFQHAGTVRTAEFTVVVK